MQRLHHSRPVNVSATREKVFVPLAVIIVDMNGEQVFAGGAQGLGRATAEITMAGVNTKADVLLSQGLDHRNQSLRFAIVAMAKVFQSNPNVLLLSVKGNVFKIRQQGSARPGMQWVVGVGEINVVSHQDIAPHGL